MDVWKYEHTYFATEWEMIAFGAPPEHSRNKWAVSIRGRVFTGFKTRRDAQAYGKHIETEGTGHLSPAVSDISHLPEALASAYETVARASGYVYDPGRLAWVRALGHAPTSGMDDDETYRSAGEAARKSFEPEVAMLLEMLEKHMETILANVRAHGGAAVEPPQQSPRQTSPDRTMRKRDIDIYLRTFRIKLIKELEEMGVVVPRLSGSVVPPRISD